MIPLVVTLLLIVQRLGELLLARRNEKWAKSRGGIEYGRDHYWMFIVLHASWFIAFNVEAFLSGGELWPGWQIAALLLIAAQGLRYWTIYSLGRYWNTRIIVIPGSDLTVSGPFRFARHPNYIAVIIEIAAVPALFDAWYTAAVFTVLNALLLFKIRIPAEERALATLEADLDSRTGGGN